MASLKCTFCGRSFEGRSDARYCGDSCRSAARHERARTRAQARPARSTALTRAINRAAAAAALTPADAAAIALARLYGRRLDAAPDQLDKLGPQLLAVLVQLGATPKARGGAGTAGPPRSAQDTVLDELRARRDTRRRRAAAPDTDDS